MVTVSTYLSAILSLKCGCLLFRSSSLHLRFSGYFNNRRRLPLFTIPSPPSTLFLISIFPSSTPSFYHIATGCVHYLFPNSGSVPHILITTCYLSFPQNSSVFVYQCPKLDNAVHGSYVSLSRVRLLLCKICLFRILPASIHLHPQS